MRRLKTDKIGIEECPVTPMLLAAMLKMIEDGTISGKIAKTVFEEMYQTCEEPEKVVKRKGLLQLSDREEILKIIERVLVENKRDVEEYKKGKTKVFGFLVGQVMKETKGNANPKLVNEILNEQINR